jgi:putative membrane protein
MLSVLSNRRASRLAAAVVATLAFVACGPRDGDLADTTDSLAGMDTSPAAATPTPTMSDAQIAHVVMTANSGDSASGVFAQANARNAQVKEYAQMMVRDHGGANKQLWELTQRLSITPEEAEVSRQLLMDVETGKANLTGKTGAEFDRIYIDQEVQLHQKVLDQLDQVLIPGTQNAELKALLQAIRPTVSMHLERAKVLQTTVVTTASGN